MSNTFSVARSTRDAIAADAPGQPVAVAIDGTAQDRPALWWAAEEASQLGLPLLITHAVGHLPVDLGYAERHTARRQRQERGQRVVDAAARWVARQVPGLTIEATTRMLEPAALLPAIGNHASVMTRSSPSWSGHGRTARPGRVVVALGDPADDADVLAYANDYADRRGAELVVLEHGRDDSYRRIGSQPGGDSLAVVARPHAPESGPRPSGDHARRGWRAALAMLARADTPVALVSDTSQRSA